MHEINEMMAELNDIKEIKKTLTSWLKEEVNAGKDCIHLESAGATSDMIKDLAEATKECLEAMYYKTVIEAMNSHKDESYDDEEVRGYNHRHLGNGELARAGHGHMVRGYRPYVDQEPYLDAYLHDPTFEHRMKEGHGNAGYNRSRHGEIYDNYQKAKMGYQESKSPTDKEAMNTHHMMYMHDTLKNMKRMWDDADPMLKKQIKEDFGEEVAEVLERM